MPEKLVFIDSQQVNEQPYTTSDVIAEYAGISHHGINVEVKKHFDRIKRAGHGKASFKMKPSPSGQKLKVFLLTEQQATLLITFLKNTPRVADFKEALVQQFFEIRRELIRQQVLFDAGKTISKDLNQAIYDNSNFTHPPFDYINMNKLIYQYALGVSSTKLKRERHVKIGHSLTEYLATDEAQAYQKVKFQVVTMLQMNLDHASIKQALDKQGILYQVTLPVKKGDVING
ncbi:Rha family transcriptional regulator [Secundilactobacillus silagei]|uniref:Uncharacterized protein n=1 Tax=Secundilactobacillus silagei JCM 19001 TaxID=1302250 RepID=A0A1Z5IGW0_9LACO|nr:Rha family transcriptional regulator [Secundilactobacillus silagei]TDG69284.1 hypothetical protein C5L25_000215 [Secundilactobacillus silagei JCM 19001]GAX01007.1 hypothetical protein IWT126_01030 [Secundilactobacillus silagei JCM 19001]